MKIGLDLHGCINQHPEFFAELSKLFTAAGHEVHVLTGSHIEKEGIEGELTGYGLTWTKLFSIADYHKSNGTKMWYDAKGNPWIDKRDWNKTKAEYCKRESIDICFDDTQAYEEFFQTPFVLIKINK